MIDIKRSNRRRISDAENLVRVAKRQGVTLNLDEANMLLGYLEGHDYQLIANDEGETLRHDEQYGDDYSEDEPYSIQDTIVFCQEMNDDLLHEDRLDEGFLSRLRKDENILDTLIVRLIHT